MTLTKKLEIIKQNGYQLEAPHDLMAITHEILDQLGSTDSYLRDELGYSTLSHWIYREDRYSAEQLREIMNRVLSDEMWFDQIGRSNDDSVFLRSFTSLVVALLLARDNKNPFLSEQEFRQIMERMIDYCQQERDLRGFVAQGGWAHAAAHVADAVDECVKHRDSTAEDCAKLWTGLSSLIRNAQEVYQAEEDERINNALIAMVETGKASVATVCSWLEAESWQRADYMESFIVRINWKHLVRSFYFGLQRAGLLGEEQARLQRIASSFASAY